MRVSVALVVASVLVLAGCGRAPVSQATGNAVQAPAVSALTGQPKLTDSLARFSQQEGRHVSAKHVPMSGGRGAAELRVSLKPEEQALLVQLYRLHARPLPAAEFPAGLVKRAYDHLAVLHHFKLPQAPRLDPAELAQSMKTRCYRDGEDNILAYESWLVGDNYQMFGKYDLKGRILKIDIETWE